MKKRPNLDIAGRELFSKKKAWKRAKKRIKAIAKAALLPEFSLSVVFVSDDAIRVLNRDFRGKDAPTDVLSFSAQEGETMPGLERVLGEIVISLDTAKAQAKALGHDRLDEIAVLFVHGVTHLLGMDHERSREEALMQTECEMAILDACGISPELALGGRSWHMETES